MEIYPSPPNSDTENQDNEDINDIEILQIEDDDEDEDRISEEDLNKIPDPSQSISNDDQTLQNQFLQACLNGDTKTVKSLLSEHKEKLDLNYCAPEGKPALYLAVISDNPNLELAEVLLSEGANPNIFVTAEETSLSRTVFHHLVDKDVDKKLEFVNIFLNHKASFMIRDTEGHTALGIAVKRGEANIVEAILAHALVNPVSQYHETYYRLCHFVMKEDFGRAWELLENVEDIHFKILEDIEPLQLANIFKKYRFTELFLWISNKERHNWRDYGK